MDINPDNIPLPIAIPLIVVIFTLWVFLIIRDKRRSKRPQTWINVDGQWRQITSVSPIDLSTYRADQIYDQDADKKEKDGFTAGS